MKILSPKVHAPIDYLLVALFGLAPTIFGFEGLSATLCYALGIGVLAMSLLTAYPLGVAKIIPFPVHGYIELAAAPLLIVAPFVLGFRDEPRIFFIVVGAAYAVVWFLTDYQAAEKPARRVERPSTTDRPHVSNRPMI